MQYKLTKESEMPLYVAVAAKVGVGLSLFIVAYVVLVKKWRTGNISIDSMLVLSMLFYFSFYFSYLRPLYIYIYI